MGGIEIDTSSGPIWLLRYPKTFLLEDFRQLFVDMRALNPEGRKIAVLVDLSDTNPISGRVSTRRDASRIVRENFDFLDATMLAEARIAPSALARGVLTVFDWFSRQPWPINNSTSGPLAEQWLRGQLDRAGLEAPGQPVWEPSGLCKLS